MNFEFTDLKGKDYTPLDFEMYSCDRKIGEDKKLKEFENVTTCICSYCTKSCPVRSQEYEAPGYFEGFNFILVIIAYVVMGVITTLTYFFHKRQEKQAEQASEGNKLADKLE